MNAVAPAPRPQALRHLRAKAALLPLLRAWQEAGVEVVLFKGFYLAEFVYPDPGERSYGDVDLLARPADSSRARALARDLGWHELWSRCASLYHYSHEESNLVRGDVFLEPHRLILDTASPWHAVQTRFTEAAWAASEVRDWEGVRVRVLALADSALMGLALARNWSGGDDWRLKASDYRDLEVLAEAGLSREALVGRAEELRCARTLALFLARCDPWRGVWRPEPPTRLQKERWQLAAWPERGHLGLERLAMRASRVPGAARDLLPYLRLAATPPEPAEVVAGPALALSVRRKERIIRGVKAAVLLVTPPGSDACVRRSKALYAALATAGYPVRLSLGRDDAGRAHAGVSMDGYSLRDLEDVQTCWPLAVSEVHEARPTESPARLAAAHEHLHDRTGDAMTQTLTDDTLLELSTEQVSVESAEETVILDPLSGRYFSLDAVGADAWKLLQTPRRLSELREELLIQYDVPPEVLEQDLRDLLERLLASGLLVARREGA